MRNSKLALLGVAVFAMTLATGCAKPPQVEIDAVKASLSGIEADASKYSAEAWNKAQQAVNAVNAEVEEQANKFALFRSYTKSKELVAAANQAITEAKDASAAAKDAAKTAANESLAAAKAALDAASAAMAGRRRHHRTRRSVMPTARAVIGSPLNQCWRSSASACAER